MNTRGTEPADGPVGHTVLVVDDDDLVRALAGRALERGGLRAIMASNGREALEVYTARGPEIDLVLMDMTMPEMDGAEAFRALQQLDPAVRVVLSSGYTEHDTSARFGDNGPAGFIQKPYRVDELLDLVTRIVSGGR